MPRYLRLEEENDTETSRNGLAWGANALEAQDLSLEPTSNGSTLRLADVSDVGTATPGEMEGEEKRARGFCYWYSKLVDRFPVSFCIILFALTAGAGAAAYKLYDIPSFDDPLKGFEARHTEIRDRTSGLQHFFYSEFHNDDFHRFLGRSSRSIASDPTMLGSSSSSSPDNSTSAGNDSFPSVMIDSRSESSVPERPLGPCIDAGSAKERTRFVFTKAGATDLFSTPAMKSVCHIYDKYIIPNGTDVGWYVRDCEPLSLGLYAAILNGKESCSEINDDDVSRLRLLLRECSPFYLNGTLVDDHASQVGLPVNCTALNGVYDIFYYLLPTDSAEKIARGDFQDIEYTLMVSPFSDWEQYIYSDNIKGRVLSDKVTKMCAVGASYKLDLFSDFLISDFKYMALGMGLIFCIVWLYTGSLFVTLMTVLDMVMSLVLSYFLYMVVFRMKFFPFINVLAIVLVIGIGADDAFVYIDIWKKMKEKHGGSSEKRVVVLQDTLHHAVITMFVTSFTTASALFSSLVCSITALRCLAIYAGCAVLINFIYTVTWLPAIVIIEDKYLKCRRCRDGMSSNNAYVSVKNIYDSIMSSCCGSARSFMEKIIPAVVFKLRFLWLVLFTLLGLGGACVIFVKPKLQFPTQTDFQVFVSSDYLEQYDQYSKKLFEFEREKGNPLPIYFLWGLVPIDNGNYWDPDDSGSLVLDKSFNLSAKESQEWLLSFCRELRKQTFYYKPGKDQDFCLIEIMQSLMSKPCQPQFSPSTCCNQSTFPYEPALFSHCAPLFLSILGLQNYARYDKNSDLTGLLVSFTSTTADTIEYETISEFWYTIDGWSKEKMQSAPVGMAGGWFVSDGDEQMEFFDLQESLAVGTTMSIGLSLAMAATVLLLTTRNLLITFYAILSIAGTVFVTIGSLVLMGWELNILESTVMNLAVGLSVDFTIHYGVAYRLAPHKDRASRSTFAMVQLSSAITTAAISTFVAGAVLLPSSVLCYQQIGTFMTLVMVVSWSFANFFFMPLCRAFGPEGRCTQIPVPSCGVQCTRNDGTCGPCRVTCCCCSREEQTVLDQRLIGDSDLGYVAE